MKKRIAQTELPRSDDWGGEVVHSRVPSGIKLILESDDDCLLRFLGQKDISEKLNKSEGEVIYYIFCDGKRTVSLPSSYAMTECQFEAQNWYYIHHQGEIPGRPGLNAMKDFSIRRLGVDGEEIRCPSRISDDRKLILADATCSVINYTRLNYPLRGMDEEKRRKREKPQDKTA